MTIEATDLRWTKVGDEGPENAWHLIEATWITRGGQFYQVKTRCGITSNWDQTFVDALPGGSERPCDNCLTLLAGDVDSSKKKSSKKA